MAATAISAKSNGIALLPWQRLLFATAVGASFGTGNGLVPMAPPIAVTVGHAVTAALVVALAFTLLERRPPRLPPWLPRWILQVVGVFLAVPIGVLLPHLLSMAIDIHAAHAPPQMTGLAILIGEGLLFGPWIALGAVVRQREVFAREQALAFELERSELARRALDARFRLLQAQVEPHFLFNTLANVQALVDGGSPRASKVLGNLIAYLRAAVPRMRDRSTTLGQELDLVRAYLELMQMRMPDRLVFRLNVGASADTLECPPMTLLTLVENSVRHGIDPSEEGGNIEVDVAVRAGRCGVRVTDNGVGLATHGSGLGTGLATLRERLQLAFDGDVQLRLTEIEPHGVRAELDFPARQAAQ
ncbi:MAG TPA: histidine kinase [Gammaproteobacteria bacterium]|nr:histidine kinase [Gammaproteobacteria bacterium]